MNDRIIGIIGGMGPEATADLYTKIVKRTKVKKDQDHFRVIIDSNAKIPDRTSAILYGGDSPVPEIVKTAKGLEQLGVEVACIPCFTSHYFFDEIQKCVSYPIINMFKELEKYLNNEHPEIKNIGVLATSGTVKMGIFNKYLPDKNIIYPDSNVQEGKVMEAIYGKDGIKSGNLEGKPIECLVVACENLINQGAEVIIFGCTEIGLALKQKYVPVLVLDPLDIVIDVLINMK